MPVTVEELDFVATTARRLLSGLTSEFGAVDPEDLTWETMAECTLIWSRKGLIPPAMAKAEASALRSLARHATSGDLTLQLEERFFAEPMLRLALQGMCTVPVSRSARLQIPDHATENVDAWLSDPIVRRPDVRTGQSKGAQHRPITAADIARLRNTLRGAHDPVDVIFADGSELEWLTNLAAGIMAEATWCTGLRPVEWPTARLYMHRDSPAGPLQVADLYASELSAAPPPEQTDDRPAFLRRVKEILHGIMTDGTPWLHVRSAKSQHARSYRLPTQRRIGLASHTPASRIVIFCATVLARRVDAAGNWKAYQRRMNKRWRDMAGEFGLATLSFYSFRHDFIERARASMSAPEVAALAGHCAASSKSHYGRPRIGGKRSAAPAHPDPEQVEALSRHFDRRRDQRLARQRLLSGVDMSPAESSPSPSPSSGR